MLEVEIDQAASDPERLSALIQAAAKREGKHPSHVSVEFVDRETISGLNRRYREKSQATDVLSFPFDGSFPHGSGGQIVICQEEAAQGAAEHGRSLEAEIDRLVVHGMLHLVGHTDDSPEELMEMERRTDSVIEGIDG